MRLRLAMFDMDGVVFEGANFWLDLHRAYGTEAEALELAKALASDYEHVARETAGTLWKGKPSGPFMELVNSRQYQPGIRELMAYLHAQNVPTAILSSGPLQLAQRAKWELGFDRVEANEVLVSEGRISGAVNVNVADSEKLRIGMDMICSFGVEPGCTAFVGDTDSDAELAAAVGLGVAYASRSERLVRSARIELAYGELGTLREVFGALNSSAGREVPPGRL
jgi:phosphoserine phosphatase